MGKKANNLPPDLSGVLLLWAIVDLKEPYLNNPRYQPGVNDPTSFISSEGAEYK
ncbi:MAG: hypothetical protein NTY95_11955 [Bacteroidia bacterium]|jgi:hypothetical protein|nr:hypothetical protein [Bacteroidia bacterium]